MGTGGPTRWAHLSPRGPCGLDGGTIALSGMSSQPKKAHVEKGGKSKRGGQFGKES